MNFKDIQFKKTYWMNVILSVFFLITFLMLQVYGQSFIGSYRLIGLWSVFSLGSIICFYHNDKELFWKLSLLTNLLLLLVGLIYLSKIVYEDPSNHFFIRLNRVSYIKLVIFSFVVSGINLKSLFQLKDTNEYLKNTPYKILFILLILSFGSSQEPYIPNITSQLREFFSLVIVLVLIRKYLTRNR